MESAPRPQARRQPTDITRSAIPENREFCDVATADGVAIERRQRYGSILAVNVEPPVALVTVMRRKFARTPVTVRASPAVLVLVSSVAYSAATSAIAPCN